ncbi:SLAIN motif-containing protein 1-like isoform X3 [Engraulis encrasicolus]|uniref:SLAIN motif-containing protein 1-like isoform X3 n=1 Tax=Engraulis encrasicolus TaxID=184585 RepID=UPI002FD16110
MEAAVLNLQMMTDVNCNNSAMNAELEVKKLQELVRKLEMQNEQLRTRANANGRTSPHILASSPLCLLGNSIASSNYCIPSPPPALSCPASLGLYNEEPFPYFQPHNHDDAASDTDYASSGDSSEPTVLDDVELLNLDSLLPCDEDSEETWLYVSSKACVWVAGGQTPLQWCRQVLDNPRPEVEAAKRSLCHRLDSARSLTCRRSTFSAQSSLDSELSTSELEDDSIALGYKLQDLTDVQVMARLQEESLRQDYASATTSASTTRRSSSFSFHLGQRGAAADSHLREEEEDDEEEEEDYGQLPPPQPRLTRPGTLQPPRGLSHSHTFSSIRDWRRSTSTPSTPSSPHYATPAFVPYQPSLPSPTPGYGSPGPEHHHQGPRPTSDKLRRSMPNLVRAPSMPSVPIPTNHVGSPASIRNSQSFDSSNALARLQSAIPSPGQLQSRVQSVGNFSASPRQPLKATAYVSPTVKGQAPMVSTSTSLQSLSSSGSSGSSGNGSGIPLPSKPSSNQATGGGGGGGGGGRSGLPRPASFIATGSVSRSKIAQPNRSLLTPPKSLATLSALRDGSWKDGCY